MKLLALLSIFLALPLYAEFQGTTSGHTATLTYSASPDGGTVNLYRGAGACSANPTFTKIQSGLPAAATTAAPVTDSTITVGSWCYYVTAIVSGSESEASNKLTLTVTPQPPTGLAGTAN